VPFFALSCQESKKEEEREIPGDACETEQCYKDLPVTCWVLTLTTSAAGSPQVLATCYSRPPAGPLPVSPASHRRIIDGLMELPKNASEKNNIGILILLIYRLHPGSILLLIPLPTPVSLAIVLSKQKKTL
jgi:hypothetical protein